MITPADRLSVGMLMRRFRVRITLIRGMILAETAVFAILLLLVRRSIDGLPDGDRTPSSQLMAVHHVFSKPRWWSSADFWRSGIIDKEAIEALIFENPPYAQDTHYYLRGPGGMNKAVKTALMLLDVPADRIHMESYGGAAELDTSVEGVAAKAQITSGGSTFGVDVARGQTVLEAAKAAGLKPPFSCQSGVCGSCRAKLTKGKVHMRARTALEDKDIEGGAIPTCRSVPATESLAISYE